MRHVLRLTAISLAACLWLCGLAAAQSTKLLDLSSVDPSLLEGFFGTWQVQNADGSKICDVELTREDTIGGLAIGIENACLDEFPVMGEVTAWRLYENFEIVFVDATWQERIRFFTPDNTYVATPEVDGITTIIQVSDEISPAP
ncbi:AprI/Inh family metalloprotease inhibitor [Aestuariivirga sp.]|uniref:AprI/Inh family metalloprotease inhibitor n=1 Tax=Aestuariivirga sp. TaxID=2650926 RepID=UPI00359349FE